MTLLNPIFHSRPYAFIFRLLLTASCLGSRAFPLSLLWLLRQIFLLSIPTLCCAVSLMHLLFLFLPLIICSGFQPFCDSIHRTKGCHYIYPYLSSFDAELNFVLLAWRKLDLSSSSSSLFYLNHPEHNCNLFLRFIKILYDQKLFTKPFPYYLSSEKIEVNADMFVSKMPIGIFLLYLESPLGGTEWPISQLCIHVRKKRSSHNKTKLSSCFVSFLTFHRNAKTSVGRNQSHLKSDCSEKASNGWRGISFHTTFASPSPYRLQLPKPLTITVF